MQFRISATSIKSWFQYRCERKFVYETMDEKVRSQIPIHEQSTGGSWIEEGNRYEDEIIAELSRQLPGQVLIPRAGEKRLSEAVSRAYLERRRSRQYAHQLLLVPTTEIRAELHLADNVRLSRGQPDLVKVEDIDGVPHFQIIDVKATQNATLFHKTQVALYGLLLESILTVHGIPGTIHPTGEIWHRTSDDRLWQVTDFQIRSYMALLRDFFHGRLRRMSRFRVEPGEGEPSRDDTPFHIYFKCEQCKFLAHCERAISDDKPPVALDLSAVPGVSQQSKKALQRLGMQTVGDMVGEVGRIQGEATDNWVLRTRGRSLIERARALVGGELRRIQGQSTLLMPPRIDHPIYLLADSDPVDGRLSTVGCLVVDEHGNEDFHIRIIQNALEELPALQFVLQVVLQTLSDIDAWNQTHSGEDALQTHLFTYEPAEASDFRDAIGRHLEAESVRNGLLHLIRIFPPEQVLAEPDYQGYHHLPASSIRSIVSDLYALPVKVSYDLARVTQALQTVGASIGTVYDPQEPFARRFSSRLSIDVCRGLAEKTIEPDTVAADVRHRLEAMHALTQWLLAENTATPAEEQFLRLKKEPFRFRDQFHPLNAGDLDVLQAQSLLDSRSALLQTLVALSRPVAVRRERFDCYAELKLLPDSIKRDRWGTLTLTFEVPEKSRQAELSAGDMGLLLSDGSADILLDPTCWKSFEASLLPPDEHTPPDHIRVQVWSTTAKTTAFQELLQQNRDGLWFLDRAFVDWNTTRIVSFLSFLSGEK